MPRRGPPGPSAGRGSAIRASRFWGSVSHSTTWAAISDDLSSQVRYSGKRTRPASGCAGSNGVTSLGNNSSRREKVHQRDVLYLEKETLDQGEPTADPVENHRRLLVVEQLHRYRARHGHRTVGQAHQLGCSTDVHVDVQPRLGRLTPGDLGMPRLKRGPRPAARRAHEPALSWPPRGTIPGWPRPLVSVSRGGSPPAGPPDRGEPWRNFSSGGWRDTSSKKGWPTNVALQPCSLNHGSSNGRLQSTWSTSRRIFFTRHCAQPRSAAACSRRPGSRATLARPCDPPVEAGDSRSARRRRAGGGGK